MTTVEADRCATIGGRSCPSGGEEATGNRDNAPEIFDVITSGLPPGLGVEAAVVLLTYSL
jgi:hypothetical protein